MNKYCQVQKSSHMHVSASSTALVGHLKAATGPGIAWWWEMDSQHAADTQRPASGLYYTERERRAMIRPGLYTDW